MVDVPENLKVKKRKSKVGLERLPQGGPLKAGRVGCIGTRSAGLIDIMGPMSTSSSIVNVFLNYN